MKKNMIVQFVCFVTALDVEEFVDKWEHYAKHLATDSADIMLQEATVLKGRNRYKYVFQHECGADDFRFDFMKGRSQEYFPEHAAKVVHAGGYKPVQLQCRHNEIKDDVKVIAFVAHTENDLSFYYRQTYRHMNIYEAYYESCAYSYVIEFFLHDQDAPALIEQLKTRTGIETAVYKEYPVIQA